MADPREAVAKDSSSVKTLNRLVEVIDCFSVEQPSWSLAELSARLDTPKSTLHRFLLGLEAHGLVLRGAGDRRWRLGYHLVIWGGVASASNSFGDLARPVMQELTAASGETAILTVYLDGEVICTDICETSQPVRVQMVVGARRPPHAGASSKILMAYLPEAEVERIIRERGLPRLCTNTITEPRALRTELARIARDGYAVSLEETDCGAWGVATPICDWRGRVVAAIGLAGPTTRYDESRVNSWVAQCSDAAQRIARMMHAGNGKPASRWGGAESNGERRIQGRR